MGREPRDERPLVSGARLGQERPKLREGKPPSVIGGQVEHRSYPRLEVSLRSGPRLRDACRHHCLPGHDIAALSITSRVA